MDVLLQALADRSRRVILDRLRDGVATAGQLGEGLGMTQPGVSRHLRVLREAELVRVEQHGRERVYSLLPDRLAELEDWLAPYRALWARRMDALHTEIARGQRQRRDEQ